MELLEEPVCVLVAILLLDSMELRVPEGVKLSAGELVAVRVSDTLGPIVIVCEGDMVGVLEIGAVGVIVLVRSGDSDLLFTTDAELVVLTLLVSILVPVIVLLPSGVFVALIVLVLHVEAVVVFDDDTDLV